MNAEKWGFSWRNQQLFFSLIINMKVYKREKSHWNTEYSIISFASHRELLVSRCTGHNCTCSFSRWYRFALFGSPEYQLVKTTLLPVDSKSVRKPSQSCAAWAAPFLILIMRAGTCWFLASLSVDLDACNLGEGANVESPSEPCAANDFCTYEKSTFLPPPMRWECSTSSCKGSFQLPRHCYHQHMVCWQELRSRWELGS